MSEEIGKIADHLPTENQTAVDVFEEAEFVPALNRHVIFSKTVCHEETSIDNYDTVIVPLSELPIDTRCYLFENSKAIFCSQNDVAINRILDFEKCVSCGRDFHRHSTPGTTLCYSCFSYRIPLLFYARDEEDRKRCLESHKEIKRIVRRRKNEINKTFAENNSEQ